MKLLKTSMYEMVNLFGDEGVAMLEEYDINVLLAREGMFPKLDEHGTVGGFVSKVHPETLEMFVEGSILTLGIYPDNMMKEAHNATGIDLGVYCRSYLVHELTHVRQALEGRLIQTKPGELTWMGEQYIFGTEGYADFPWEEEALVNQLEYMLGCKERAKEAYQYIAKNMVA